MELHFLLAQRSSILPVNAIVVTMMVWSILEGKLGLQLVQILGYWLE